MITVRPRASDSEGVGGHRTRVSILALAIALTLLSVFTAGAGATAKPVRTLAAADQLEGQVLVELNRIRRQHGLTPVRLSRPQSEHRG